MTFTSDLSLKSRLFLIAICFLLVFGAVFGSYSTAYASGTIVVEGTFLYWLYITLMGGATYDSYEASKRSYESFKSDYPHAFENFKSNIGNITKAYMNVMNTGEGLSGEAGLQTAGAEIGKALPEALSSIWQSLNTWLDGVLSSDLSNGIFYSDIIGGYHIEVISLPNGNFVFVDGRNVGMITTSSWRITSFDPWIDGTLCFNYTASRIDNSSWTVSNFSSFDISIQGDIRDDYTGYSPSIADSFPTTGFPEYSPGKPAVPFPFFPPGFGNPGADGSGWTYTPGVPVEVPMGDIANPDGSLKHPGDWTGDWVGGIPVPGTGAGTGSVPGGWTGTIPYPGTIPGNPAIPGVGDNTWAGDNVIPGDTTIPETDTVIPDISSPPGEIDWSPILEAGRGIKEKFPFCLPFDLVKIVQSFVSASEAPRWDIGLKVPDFMGTTKTTKEHKISIDFAQFGTFAMISRVFTTAIFIVALIMASRKLIGG